MESAHRLGSVRQETDAAGAVTVAREWSPYGEEIGGAQAGLGFTGEWYDANVGLTYLRARWYDGAIGRFASQDLWKGDNRRPQSLNGWIYVVGNPVNLTDPSGLTPKCDDPFPFPRCFIIYITGFMGGQPGGWAERGQHEFLNRLTDIPIEKLEEEGSPDSLIRPFWPGNYSWTDPIGAAYRTSAGEIAMANEIDNQLSEKGAKDSDKINIIAWSGGAQMAVGGAAQMSYHVDCVVTLGGVFRADEGLKNIGLVYDLFGDQDKYRKPIALDPRVPLSWEWDQYNHGWLAEVDAIPGGGVYYDPGLAYKYHPEFDLYTQGLIKYIPITGSDHFGYFAPGKADAILAQIKLCGLYLPIRLRQ